MFQTEVVEKKHIFSPPKITPFMEVNVENRGRVGQAKYDDRKRRMRCVCWIRLQPHTQDLNT
jgi:hypothetical protein